MSIYKFHEQAQALKNNRIWKAIDKITLKEAVISWFGTLGKLTALNY